jgi:titin
MSYQCTNGVNAKRVNNFSNPGVAYNGYDTGVSYESSPATSADNVRSMGNTAAVIAGFRAGAVTAPPVAPSGLGASAANASSVTLRWNDNAGDESGFEVWRSPDGTEAGYGKVATLGANATAWTDNGLQANTHYWWKVRSYNAAGSSAFAAAADAATLDNAPLAPSAVSATFASSTASVTVTWTDGSGNETGFEVRRETQNTRKGTWGAATIVGSTGADSTALVDQPGSGTYRYSVRALNAGGASAWSAPSASVQVTSSTSTKGGGKGRNKTR